MLGLPVLGLQDVLLVGDQAGASAYSASNTAKMFAASSCSPSTGMVIEPEQPLTEVIWWPWLSWPRT